MAGSLRTTFAAELRRLRQARSLTQEELADRAGLTVNAIGALERGERTRPYPHTVRSLADALRLDEAERAHLQSCIPSRTRSPRGLGDRLPSLAGSPEAVGLVPGDAFVGRDAEVARIAELVRPGHRRLVTITGPGGVGKTRVAVEVLAREAASFAGGAVFVDLSPLHDSALVLQRVAAALGLPERAEADPLGVLVPALAGRPLLLVLDNFEHLLDAATSVANLAAHCPELVVMVTSRAALRVRAEREVPLLPLPVPDRDSPEQVSASPAAQLLLDRMAAAGVAVDLDADSAAIIGEICRRLDGLPLAIELAAAGTRLLTPAALLNRLGDAAFDPGLRDLGERQRTMTSALDWSVKLLEPGPSSLFDSLAVFFGGFTLPAVEAVAGATGDVLTDLGALVEHSLVTRAEPPDDQPRFRMLEPVRQYAAHRLSASGEASVLAARHARYFHDRAMRAGRLLQGADLALELDRLEVDHANLRSSYLGLLEMDRLAEAAEMAGRLWLFLALRGHAREGLSWLDRLDTGASDAARCQALTGRLGLLFATGQIDRMREDAGTAVLLARRVDDLALASETLTLAGHAAVFAGDLPGARALLDDALAWAGRGQVGWVEAHALVALGQLALVSGDHPEAQRVLDRAVASARSLGNPFTLATCLTRRATLTALQGDDEATAAMLGESISLSLAARLAWTLSYALPALAGVAVRLDQAEAAATLFGASASLSAAHAVDPRFPVTLELAARDVAEARSRLGDQAFRDAWDAGRVASQDEVAELADGLTRLARR